MPQTRPTAAVPQTAAPKPPAPPVEFQEGAIATMGAPALIHILTDAASPEFQKAKACQRAGELGAKEAVPALAALLTEDGCDEQESQRKDDCFHGFIHSERAEAPGSSDQATASG